MTRFTSHRNDPMSQPSGNAESDAYLIDQDFDDFLDRELAAFRETLADSISL